jgi:lipopolysaccharide transport system ATP-binding protein
MSKPIISVENLGKSYLVGHQSGKGESYTALRDVVGRSVKSFGRKAWDMARGRQIIQGDEVEEFWAMKDVSFEVNQGEVVGIIGRNGAGKSTLLKVLSRITEPTKGRVTLRGRVASLLEVGTGFHPELTGRENIFLNGAILGMTRAEIKRKFDEIVDFAGVEKFLDTPVKRYSSGMYVRLAFAVAAHLDPEILVVDEVLAVGDLEFQKKCLGKMKDVAAGGRTVLFVSHNMAAITQLCQTGIYLSAGSVSAISTAKNAVDLYISNAVVDQNEQMTKKLQSAPPSSPVCIEAIATVDEKRSAKTCFLHDEPIKLKIRVGRNGTAPRNLSCCIALQDHESRRVFTDFHLLEGQMSGTALEVEIDLPKKLLTAGDYSFIASLHTFQGEVFHRVTDVANFSIVDNGSKISVFAQGTSGCIIANCKWQFAEQIHQLDSP